MSDDEFKPRLGRIRARETSGKRARKFLGKVVAATARTGASTGVRSRRFDGSRIGRGGSIGRVLRGGDRHAGSRVRRVVVKARLVKLGSKGVSASRAHLRYIQRDSATRMERLAVFTLPSVTLPTARHSSSVAVVTATSSALSSRRRTAINIPTSNHSCAG